MYNIRAPLLRAAIGGHRDLAMMLLRSNADIKTDYWGYNVLMAAVEGNNAELVSYILSTKSIDVNEQCKGATALSYARDSTIIRQLIADKCDVNPLYGRTVLHSACAHGSVESVQVLLSARADVNCTQKGGLMLSLLSSSVSSNDSPFILENKQKILSMLCDAGHYPANKSILHSCARNSTQVSVCIAETVLTYAPGEVHDVVNDETPLYVAVQSANTKMIELLIKYRSDVHVRCGGGAEDTTLTPLEQALYQSTSLPLRTLEVILDVAADTMDAASCRQYRHRCMHMLGGALYSPKTRKSVRKIRALMHMLRNSPFWKRICTNEDGVHASVTTLMIPHMSDDMPGRVHVYGDEDIAAVYRIIADDILRTQFTHWM
jgi:ankyrin repeat protein